MLAIQPSGIIILLTQFLRIAETDLLTARPAIDRFADRPFILERISLQYCRCLIALIADDVYVVGPRSTIIPADRLYHCRNVRRTAKLPRESAQMAAKLSKPGG